MVPFDDGSEGSYLAESRQNDESCFTGASHSSLPFAITFCYRRGRAVIFKSVITALGNPDYIRMLINPEERVVIVQVCDKRERNAIEVPRNLCKDGVTFLINSVAFLESLTKLMNWSRQLTYRVKGELRTESSFMLFLLDEAEIVHEPDGGEPDAP